MLKIENLNSFYGKSHILWDISLNVTKNRITALVGRNGMGKTTMLKSIIGLINSKNGNILIEGMPIEHKQPYEIARLGVSYVPDNLGIFPTLSVEESILLASHLSKRGGVWNLKSIYLLFPELQILKKNKAGHLSGGEKKMLSIGRALISNPKLLLIDEPTEGLAPLVVRNLIEAMKKIKQSGVTILMADQNINLIKSIADEIYIIEQGSIKYNGTMDEVERDKNMLTKYLSV